MPRYETTIHTPWSPDRAFAYMSDLRHFADWDPGVERSIQVSGRAPGLGATYAVTVRNPGRNLTLEYKTITYDPPHRIEVRAESRTMVSIDSVSVSDHADGGAVVTYVADLSLRGPLAIGHPLLAIAFQRIGDRAAAGLREALEGTAA